MLITIEVNVFISGTLCGYVNGAFVGWMLDDIILYYTRLDYIECNFLLFSFLNTVVLKYNMFLIVLYVIEYVFKVQLMYCF